MTNFSFSCSPSGFSVQGGAFFHPRSIIEHLKALADTHISGCPYCQFNRDAQTQRDVR